MTIPGTVFRVHSGNYHVATIEQGTVVCKLRGNLKKEFVYRTSGSLPRKVESAKKQRRTDPISVGDRVEIDTDLKIIEAVEPRRSQLSRTSPSKRGQHTLVANVDQTLLACAALEPAPDLWLLDRFIVMVEEADIDVVLIINKMDQVKFDKSVLHDTFDVYRKIGYKVFYVSAREKIGLEAVKDVLVGKVSAIAGPSGVGKSRLLNALCPDANQKVGDISMMTQRGKHTTTSAELIPLDSTAQSWIADTPGLQQLEFWDVDKEDIPYCFREFKPYFGTCRYADCIHFDEPGCGIRAAFEAGEIDARRYQSYKQIMSGDSPY
jgi:ribosome biogenesis GTPase